MGRALACGMLLLAGSLRAAEPGEAKDQAPKFAYQLRKQDDSATFQPRPDGGVLLLTSPSGIGSATIVRTAGAWPKSVTLRLRYDDKRGFQRLESFSLTTGRMRMTGASADSGKLRFYLADPAGKFPSDEFPTGTVNVVFTPHAGWLEIDLPAHLLSGDRVEIGWIDAFRG